MAEYIIEHVDVGSFARWFRRLGPIEKATVVREFERLVTNGADVRMPRVRDLGEGLRELRIRSGAHPRIYFQVDGVRIVMLTYGRKDTQSRDIARARRRMT